MRLYQVGDSSSEDVQTVVTFLSSMQNPSPSEQHHKSHVDKILSEALDRILIADRVRSCTDYYLTNNKKTVGKEHMVVN